MKTEKNKISYTSKRGGKNQRDCDGCKLIGNLSTIRAYNMKYKIRGRKIGIFCSPCCIDRYIDWEKRRAPRPVTGVQRRAAK